MNLNTISNIRTLAKSSYFQTIYSAAKEQDVKIFENNINFTDLQITFLKYLGFYSVLLTDIVLGDVDEIVLTNEIYEDSYMLYKSKKDRKTLASNNKEQSAPQKTSSWIFKNPPRSE